MKDNIQVQNIIKRIKSIRGSDEEKEFELYNSIIAYIKTLSKDEIDRIMPILLKNIYKNCSNTFYKFPYLLLLEMNLLYNSEEYYKLTNIYKRISKKTIDVLRHYVCIGNNPEEAYIWALDVDERYHPLTWKIVSKDFLYRSKYIDNLKAEMPKKEIEKYQFKPEKWKITESVQLFKKMGNRWEFNDED